MNRNDEIRENILKFIYEKYKNASGINLAKVTDIEAQNALRQQGFNNSEIISNFLYLVQSGWIKKETKSWSIGKTRGKTDYYLASDKTINHFEGPSIFQKSNWMTGINITNIQGVTVIGDNNYVNQQFTELYRDLDLLLEEVKKSAVIFDQDKLNYQAEIKTIKEQLAKQTPNKNIIKEAWTSLTILSTIEGVMQFYTRVEPLIKSLLIH